MRSVRGKTYSGYAGLFLTRHEAELQAMSDQANARIAYVLAQTGMPVPVQIEEQEK